jgi:hypothetical protein
MEAGKALWLLEMAAVAAEMAAVRIFARKSKVQISIL